MHILTVHNVKIIEQNPIANTDVKSGLSARSKYSSSNNSCNLGPVLRGLALPYIHRILNILPSIRQVIICHLSHLAKENIGRYKQYVKWCFANEQFKQLAYP